MARINLLPWREERRKVRNRETQTLFGIVAMASIAAVIALVWWHGQLIKDQLARNDFLQAEIAIVDQKIKEIEGIDRERSRLLARKQVIEQLQASRSVMVHLFDDLVKTIPEGVRLTSIKQAGDLLTLEGFAESNARVSEYMKRLETSEWLVNPDLGIVEAKGPDKRSRYAFTLRVNLKKIEQPEDPNAPADPAAAAPAQGATS